MDLSYLLIGAPAGADPTAWVALLLSVSVFAWTIWNEYASARRRQADEYWYRRILGPNCIEPLVEFLNDHINRLQLINVGSLTAEASRDFCADFAQRKEALLAKLWISRLFSADYYDFACRRLDDVEDIMSSTFGSWLVKPAVAAQGDLVELREQAITRVTEVLAMAAKIRMSGLRRNGSPWLWVRRLLLRS
jgi:hypothetical protein